MTMATLMIMIFKLKTVYHQHGMLMKMYLKKTGLNCLMIVIIAILMGFKCLLIFYNKIYHIKKFYTTFCWSSIGVRLKHAGNLYLNKYGKLKIIFNFYITKMSQTVGDLNCGVLNNWAKLHICMPSSFT